MTSNARVHMSAVMLEVALKFTVRVLSMKESGLTFPTVVIRTIVRIHMALLLLTSIQPFPAIVVMSFARKKYTKHAY